MNATDRPDGTPTVGDIIGPVVVGEYAHQGHWIVRHEGMVVFARHALEGETVRVRITSLAKRFARGDVVEVVSPSPHRVEPPCPVAGRCGGCDFQHVEPAHQRELKRRVVAEQMSRLAGLDFTGHVEAVDPPALGWRLRMRYHRTSDAPGWGLRAHRSDEVVPLPETGCLIADPELRRPNDTAPDAPEVVGAHAEDGVHWVAPGDDLLVRQVVDGRTYRVRADGFWQVHRAAASTLTRAVLDALDPQPGESALDLYCGVGLFSGALDARGVRVTGVEGGKTATTLAARNVPRGRFVAGSVEKVMGRLPRAVDLVVLDPPRVGAGVAVMDAIIARRPRAVAYVSCDPATLARDLGRARDGGYEVTSLRVFDLFGMTHHLESVAVLKPRSAG